MIGNNVFGHRNRAIVDNNDLEEIASQALNIKAAKTGFEGLWLIQMRDNN
jgi:hypothetical protein